MEKVLNQIVSELGKINGRLDKMDGRFDKMDGRFDKMDGRFDKMDGRFDKLEIKVNKNGNLIEKFEKEVYGNGILLEDMRDRIKAIGEGHGAIMITIKKTEDRLCEKIAVLEAKTMGLRNFVDNKFAKFEKMGV